ncbi:MAG: response regulator [Deltaproteobacteria bacterium]
MGLRILAVDNEDDVLKLIKGLAEAQGCEVLAYKTGLEAANQSQHQKFDGAFVGASIPYMDGFVLVELMRKSPSNNRVPIVMLTEFGDVKTMRRAFQAGVTFFLNKPLDPKRMKGLLASMRGAMLVEKRRYARLPLRTIVQCTADKRQTKTLSVNVSQTGILLEASEGLAVGQAAELNFELPDITGQLNPRANVVRIEPAGRTGLRFLSLSPQDKQALADFIAGNIKG